MKSLILTLTAITLVAALIGGAQYLTVRHAEAQARQAEAQALIAQHEPARLLAVAAAASINANSALVVLMTLALTIGVLRRPVASIAPPELEEFNDDGAL